MNQHLAIKKLLTSSSCLFWLACFVVGTEAYAQRTVSGTVTDENNNELPGVNILLQNTTVGTVTNVDGNYSIAIQGDNPVLIFSSVGYEAQTVEITNQSTVNISMAPDTRQLGEVVVTAFGVEKEKKSLGYAVQDVSGEELSETTRPNVIESLQGRVAGVNVTSTNGLPGSSTSIVIRGGTSLDGNNQPLFVVDGIPIDNTTLDGGFLFSDTPNRNFDYTSRGSDINPEDIESITVLKGPAAAALYGIDAANGAIVITTKKGKAGQSTITYTNDFRLENMTRFPDRLTTFNTGEEGINNNLTRSHWGAPIEAGTPVYNNVEEFFETGFTQNHSLGLSGGSGNLTYRASADLLDQEGTVPNTGFNRNSFRLNLTSKASERLSLTASANYIKSQADRTSKGNGSLYQSALLWPVTDNMSNYLNPDGTPRRFFENGNDNFDNPYFTANRNINTDETDRFLLNGSVDYQLLDWLSVTGRIGADVYNTLGLTAYDDESFQRYPNRSIAASVGGLMAEYEARSRLINSFLLLNANKTFGDFTTSLTLGHNLEDRTYRVDSRYGENILVPDLYTIVNTQQDTREVSVSGYQRRLIGVFGDFRADYKNMIFLNITARNDWSSTLPKQNNSFFYPSISTSVVLSEMLDFDVNTPISFLKLRASYAEVGKDAPPHRTQPSLNEFTRTGGGFNVGFFGANQNILPESTSSYEFGLDLRMFENRIGVDATYYYVKSEDQIVSPRLSYATGYILQLLNAGAIENRGVELMINADIVKNSSFRWNAVANFSLNRNKVLSLPGDFEEFYLSDTWLSGNARGGYVPGETFYTITGNSREVNEAGQFIMGDNGYPVENTDFNQIGNRQPDFTLGFTNTLEYKGWRLSFLLDMRRGGDIYNATARSLTVNGLDPRTANRGETVVFEGVTESGEVNTQEVVLDQDYYQTSSQGALESLFIEKDINWVRLRDITLAYEFPKALLQNTFLSQASLHITGNNLLLITNYTGADPDVNGLNASGRGSNAGGFDFFSLAAPVVYSAGLRVTF
ncbi:SusC/RagA family TonB-linked outer membrane protein [Tunicatimonas pelagia]|uniref:SusC/RagA family TonB-linked outer membrane protein n=1 Tax=Tunicatimonas pelagia TaxID=931531 RepID=UPI002664F1C3|nr:SusC/RagA family TonB-linked outer membrane protein [Tunicatimonas pelagia]WKN43371.1 SusC/RagA family TonB-linked outer membrane protein [Tunicatimonas pelagia]